MNKNDFICEEARNIIMSIFKLDKDEDGRYFLKENYGKAIIFLDKTEYDVLKEWYDGAEDLF